MTEFGNIHFKLLDALKKEFKVATIGVHLYAVSMPGFDFPASLSLKLLVSPSGFFIQSFVGVCVTPYSRRRICPEFIHTSNFRFTTRGSKFTEF